VLEAEEGGEFTYSPNGQQIAIATHEDISLVAADGSDLWHALSFDPVVTMSEFRFVPSPVWAADGQSLRVAIPPADPFGDPGQPTQVWAIAVDRSAPTLVASLEAQPAQPLSSFSADLRRVAYLGQSEGALLVTDLRTGQTTTHAVQAGDVYGWAPDSQRFAFLANLSLPQAQIFELEGNIVPAHEDEAAVAIDLAWMDAERYVYLTQTDGQGWDLVLADVRGTRTTVATVPGRPPTYHVAR
jgi:hypothetical protein